MEDHYIERLIDDYERDILGNQYTFYLSDQQTIPLMIPPRRVPHLLGVRKLPLRQVQQNSALNIYKKLKFGAITLHHIAPFKEEYKKVMNFHHLISILHCGDAVKIVKRIGDLKSDYLFYLDHRPERIIHLAVAQDEHGIWYPESFSVNQGRVISAYIDGQIPVDILRMDIEHYEL